jgi:phosphatidylserine/phosphatidylglycerophosphate/cardiolipin synthase-like enzyme
MKDPIKKPTERSDDADRHVSRRSVLYGLAAAMTAPLALDAAKAGATGRTAGRAPSRAGKGRKLKALPRHQHTATLLRSGAILIAGGANNGSLADARTYANDAWSAAAAMSAPRARHSATLLADGRVLVLGGFNGAAMASAEIYDPAADTWTPARPLAAPRCDHAAALLPDGRVLVTGGFNRGPIEAAEIYSV